MELLWIKGKKKFQEKQQQNNSESHSLTEVLVKPKLNSAAVWNMSAFRYVIFTKEAQIHSFVYFNTNFYTEKNNTHWSQKGQRSITTQNVSVKRGAKNSNLMKSTLKNLASNNHPKKRYRGVLMTTTCLEQPRVSKILCLKFPKYIASRHICQATIDAREIF